LRAKASLNSKPYDGPPPALPDTHPGLPAAGAK